MSAQHAPQFNMDLRRAAATAKLAKSFYDSYALYCGLTLPAWRTLTPVEKRGWCQAAHDWLVVKDKPRGMPPVVVVTGLRPVTGGRLIGQIRPGEAL